MSKILSITWYKVLPPKYGGQKGIALFTKYLARFFEIVLLCSQNNEQDPAMPFEIKAELPTSKSQFFDPACWRKIVNAARTLKPAYIILEHPYHGFAGHLSARRSRAKLIVHAHNIESRRFRAVGKWWWFLLSRYERWVFRKADLLLFKTDTDLQWTINHFSIQENKCLLVPYGIERKPRPDKLKAKQFICQQHGLGDNIKILLFAGTLDYEANADAVEMIFKEIAPRLKEENDEHFKILICGRNHYAKFQYLKRLKHPDVLYIGEVEDIDPYFAGSDIFLNPVKSGGGVQSKTIEALAFDLNIVCFKEQVNEQIIDLAGKKIFASGSGDYPSMTKNIRAAFENRGVTPAAFYEHYDWANITSTLHQKLVNFQND